MIFESRWNGERDDGRKKSLWAIGGENRKERAKKGKESEGGPFPPEKKPFQMLYIARN